MVAVVQALTAIGIAYYASESARLRKVAEAEHHELQTQTRILRHQMRRESVPYLYVSPPIPMFRLWRSFGPALTAQLLRDSYSSDTSSDPDDLKVELAALDRFVISPYFGRADAVVVVRNVGSTSATRISGAIWHHNAKKRLSVLHETHDHLSPGAASYLAFAYATGDFQLGELLRAYGPESHALEEVLQSTPTDRSRLVVTCLSTDGIPIAFRRDFVVRWNINQGFWTSAWVQVSHWPPHPN
jgi:hypothetical protein